MTLPRHARLFEEARPRLLGLAYRLLGSSADAEDAVQDTYMRWLRADRKAIKVPAAWLTTACTNRCLDILKSGARQRMDYVGPWLPEPLQTVTQDTAEEAHQLADTLSTAFLLLLQRLTAKERAAYLLREIFSQPYPLVAETLGLTEPACRQLVSRAKRHIGKERVRARPEEMRQMELLRAFEAALTTGSTTGLDRLLSADIQLHADGGGKVIAARRILHGPERVLPFIEKALAPNWREFKLTPCQMNGLAGILVTKGSGVIAAVSLDWDGAGTLSRIYITRNPDKLLRLRRRYGSLGKAGLIELEEICADTMPAAKGMGRNRHIG